MKLLLAVMLPQCLLNFNDVYDLFMVWHEKAADLLLLFLYSLPKILYSVGEIYNLDDTLFISFVRNIGAVLQLAM